MMNVNTIITLVIPLVALAVVVPYVLMLCAWQKRKEWEERQ